jgi:hypothetical protein
MTKAIATIEPTDAETKFVPTWDWMRAGKAVFTVHNANGTHYTYRITKGETSARYPDPAMFLSLLTGQDNEKDYTYLGIVRPNGAVAMTRNSRMRSDSLPVKVAAWAIRTIREGKAIPEGYGILSDGRCGRCGRKLTVPASVYGGYGPECIKKIR